MNAGIAYLNYLRGGSAEAVKLEFGGYAGTADSELRHPEATSLESHFPRENAVLHAAQKAHELWNRSKMKGPHPRLDASPMSIQIVEIYSPGICGF